MGHEIERKFLLRSGAWRSAIASSTRIRQGFLPTSGPAFVRIRIGGDKATLTIKAAKGSFTRLKDDYPIPTTEAEELLEHCQRPLIDKTRHRIHQGNLTWEIDEFHAENAGLIVAEVELEREDQHIDLPPWIGQEVTDDPR